MNPEQTKRPLRIGVLCHPTYGGSGVVATELGLAMARRGHLVHFVNYQTPIRLSSYEPNIRYHEVEVSTYPLFRYPPYDLALAAQLAEVAHEEGLDVVHAHYAIPHAVAAELGREICKDCHPPYKVITTLHGTDITLVGSDRSFYRLTRWGLESSDAVTTVSAWLAEATRREFAPSVPLRVIPNFVDTERFAPGCGKSVRPELAQGEPLLVHMSNFRPVKRTQDVVEVFRRVAERLPCRLALIGAGPDLSGVQRRIRELKLGDRVVYLGLQNAVAEVLAAGELFLLPSDHEGFGLAALEAMACGTPVIGTRSGGLPEVVEDGRCGRLYEVGDVDAMAAGAIELLGDRERLAAFSRAARERAVERYSLDKVVRQYEAVYEELAGCGD